MEVVMKKMLIIFLILFFAIFLKFYSLSEASVNIITMNYFGSAAITSPAGMESVDLAFHLELSPEGAVDPVKSYILPGKTLVFPVTGTVDSVEAGPMVASGLVTESVFQLTVAPFTSTAAGKQVSRGITLSGAPAASQPGVYTGVYTETITGFLATPVVVTGEFLLFAPVAGLDSAHACAAQDTLLPLGELTIEEIRAGGESAQAVDRKSVV
jgi:hypothetical protein